MPQPYLRSCLHWNQHHSDVGSKLLKAKSPNVFFWDVADHTEKGKEAALLDLDLFQRSWLTDALFWKLLLPVFLSITPALIFSANESSVWSLNYYCDHWYWNWERRLNFSYIFAARVWNSASYRRCSAFRSCPAVPCFRNSFWEERCKLLCITYLTLACRVPTSSNSKLGHCWENDTWELPAYSVGDLGSRRRMRAVASVGALIAA